MFVAQFEFIVMFVALVVLIFGPEVVVVLLHLLCAVGQFVASIVLAIVSVSVQCVPADAAV